jgi:predicted choloylglycine hydrolase
MGSIGRRAPAPATVDVTPVTALATEFAFEAIAEEQPGPKWKALFDRFWPAYERWFLRDGDSARPRYLSSLRALRTHMPELVPTYERLVELAGDSDTIARFLSSFCPPSYFIACSQAVWSADRPFLVRNYDYSPQLTEGVVFKSAWNGRRVISMNDCMWGALDGINEDGLAVSLSFGGRQVVGAGFGVPLVLRYILEFCTTTDDATSVLERIPVHMSYNVTVVDASGKFVTAYLRPDQPAVVRAVPYAANHQEEIEWEQHANATSTLARERFLYEQLRGGARDPGSFVESFLRPPLHSNAFASGYGTLYTAVYRPLDRRAEYRWPNGRWDFGFDAFEEGSRTLRLDALPAPGDAAGVRAT